MNQELETLYSTARQLPHLATVLPEDSCLESQEDFKGALRWLLWSDDQDAGDIRSSIFKLKSSTSISLPSLPVDEVEYTEEVDDDLLDNFSITIGDCTYNAFLSEPELVKALYKRKPLYSRVGVPASVVLDIN